MRLAAISDMHGNAVAFEAVINDLRAQSPDVVVCLGDVVMRGPQPQECVEMLRSLKPRLTVRGNYDHRCSGWPAPGWTPKTAKEELLLRDVAYTCGHLSGEDREWLANLPVGASICLGGVHMEMYHAAPGSLGQYTWPWASNEELSRLRVDDSTQLVLFGHMHHPFVRTANGLTVVNIGSVGLSFDGDNRASYAVIDIDEGRFCSQIRRVAYDVEASIRIARDLGMPDVDLFAQAVRQATFPYPAG